MRIRACRLPLAACLAMASIATSAFAGASIVEPYAPSPQLQGMEVGAWAAISTPNKAAGEIYDRGWKLGLSMTQMATPGFGIGVDMSYSRWPSTRAGDEWDRYFTEASGGAPIFGTKVTLTGVQAGVHCRVVPMPRELLTPWLQLGAGMARVQYRVEPPLDRLEAAGLEEEASIDESFNAPVVSAALGLDLRQSRDVKLGLEAKYEWIFNSAASQPFTSITIGAHLRFGSW
jgi:hypothetical protein